MATTSPPARNRAATGVLVTEGELTVYLSYDYLPPGQLAAILSSVAGVHRAVMLTSLSLETSAAAILCLTQVTTGESIHIKYGGFTMKREGDDTNIYLPNWSRSLVEVGEILLFVAMVSTAVDHFHDKLAKHQQTAEPPSTSVPYDVRRLSRASDPAGEEARTHALLFHQHVNAPNIRVVKINGVEIRRREDEDENGRDGKPVQT